MASNNDYYLSRQINTINKLYRLTEKLPLFMQEFFLGIESNTAPLTRLNYAMDITIFFDFISQKYSIPLSDFTIQILNKITAFDIEQFLSYITSFDYNGTHHTCNDKAKARKLASIRCMYRYFFNHDRIIANTAAKIRTPKIREKEIIRLENSEIKDLLYTAETGAGLSSRQLAYQKNTAVRDVALLTMFLGTGIRISELVGLNTDDIFFENNSFIVTRKGGARTILYFTDEVKVELINWLNEREKIEDLPKDEKALFLSLKNKRISVRAVQNLVSKYAKIVSPLKHITPHKLRSTFGTKLYRETGDIYVVADYLGHRDINTTKRHYAAMSEDIRKTAIEKVNLRDNEDT
ncbi:MAG: tyrosine-type recombinase/integrase [Clostridia bacterium]|nr:tyrosine-type recombinase/integrase [Clostridia bacterium]